MKPSFLAVALAALLGSGVAYAVTAIVAPTGQPVLNQARQGVLLVKSNTTTFLPTRGIHIGDGTACDVTVRFVGDNASTFTALENMQPGSDHPYSIIQLGSATTCTAVEALY